MEGYIKKSGIYFDTYPKEGSDNAVTSDGIYKAIQAGGGGGGGGTTDYTMLTNKPRINGVELTGNKSLASLSIAGTAELDQVKNDIQGINADIIDLEEGKADKSQIPDMRDYTTKTETEAVASRVTEAETDIASLENALQGKADTSTVTSLYGRVAACEGDIINLQSEVGGKADASAVTALTARVSGVETDVGELSDLDTQDKTSLVNAVNEIASMSGSTDTYSTNETKTNKVWIDGKPIYRRVLVTTTSFAISTNWVNVTYYCGSPTLNIETLVHAEKVNDKGFYISLAGSNQINIARATSDQQVNVGTAFIIEYTKTS